MYVRPPDLQDFVEAQIVTLSPRSAAARRSSMIAGGVVAAAIVAGSIQASGERVAAPAWWWFFIALGWLCLSWLTGALLWTVFASREPWLCGTCGSRLQKRNATDTHPRLGDLDATIFVCRRCRAFEAHLGTPPTSWS
jgi:hypothetical protein